MVVRKRTTRKTGNYSKSTHTNSSTGKVTQSFSSKPPGSPTRRTVSFSNGKMRTTYSTKQGGGWTKVKSKTISLVSKPKAVKSPVFSFGSSRSRKKKEEEEVYDDGESGEFSWFWLVIGLIIYPFLLPFKFGVWIGWAFYLFIYFYFFG